MLSIVTVFAYQVNAIAGLGGRRSTHCIGEPDGLRATCFGLREALQDCSDLRLQGTAIAFSALLQAFDDFRCEVSYEDLAHAHMIAKC